MSTLSEYLESKGCYVIEGHCGQVDAQREDLLRITSQPNSKVMEIGFNAGHSAETFLLNNPTLTLVSFDIGEHAYLLEGKKYIDKTFPGRHTLILGDSTASVPNYIAHNPDVKFDVIFIDGGHDYPVCSADMANSMKLAHNDTILIMDDTTYTIGWAVGYTIGPTQVWTEYEHAGLVKAIGKRDYDVGRGMTWGKRI